MSRNSYIPTTFSEFHAWQENLNEKVKLKLADWGILEAHFTALQETQTLWRAVWAKNEVKQNRTQVDVQAKNDLHRDYVKQIRWFVGHWLAKNPRVSDADREDLGITIYDKTKTSTPAPTEVPFGDADFSIGGQHNFYFGNSTDFGRKPDGVHACELFMKIGGEPPIDISELTYVTSATRSPHIVKFSGEDVGKIVYYWIRWVNAKGEPGPWNKSIRAIVA